MATDKNPKTLEDLLVEKSNKGIEDHKRQEGKKFIEQQVEENLIKFEEDSETITKGIKEKLSQGFAKCKLNLHSTLLFLLCLQLSISLILLLLLYIFSFVLALLLIWVLMFVGCIYCSAYCLLSRYPDRFKKSSSAFTMCIILACCEAVVLCFMSMPIDSRVFLIEVSMIIISLFNASLIAKCLKNKYKASTGLMMAILSTAVVYIIFFFAESSLRV